MSRLVLLLMYTTNLVIELGLMLLAIYWCRKRCSITLMISLGIWYWLFLLNGEMSWVFILRRTINSRFSCSCWLNFRVFMKIYPCIIEILISIVSLHLVTIRSILGLIWGFFYYGSCNRISLWSVFRLYDNSLII